MEPGSPDGASGTVQGISRWVICLSYSHFHAKTGLYTSILERRKIKLIQIFIAGGCEMVVVALSKVKV